MTPLNRIDAFRRSAGPGHLRLAALAFALAGLVACSPDDSSTPVPIAVTILPSPTRAAQATPTSPAVTPTPAASPTPLPPNPVTVALPDPIDTLHPFYAASSSAQTVLGAIYVGCIGEDQSSTPVALGCEQVPSLENGLAKYVGEGPDRHLEATFHIRPGWRWTDGTPVTSADAIYGWRILMAPEAGLRDPLTQKVFSMAAPDSRTIVVSFMSAAQAQAAAVGQLNGDVEFQYFAQLGDYARYTDQTAPLTDADYWAVIRWLPQHLLKDIAPKDQAGSDYAKHPIGDGPFEIRTIDPATGASLIRSAQPFPLGAPAIDGIEFSLVNPSTPETATQVGTIMAVEPGMTTTGAISFQSNLAEQLVLNLERFPFQDANVRLALATAIDRDGLLKALGLNGFAAPITSTIAYDPAKAAQILAEAGWSCVTYPCTKALPDTRGQIVTRTLEFTMITTERAPRNLVAQAIQKQLAAVGFGVNIEIVYGVGGASKLLAPYEQGGALATRNFDAALFQAPQPATLRGAFDCESIPNDKAHGGSRGNFSGYCDTATDALIAEAESGESVMSGEAHAAALAAARAAVDQAVPGIRLYWLRDRVRVAGVANLKPGPDVPLTWNAWEWAQQGAPR